MPSGAYGSLQDKRTMNKKHGETFCQDYQNKNWASQGKIQMLLWKVETGPEVK